DRGVRLKSRRFRHLLLGPQRAIAADAAQEDVVIARTIAVPGYVEVALRIGSGRWHPRAGAIWGRRTACPTADLDRARPTRPLLLAPQHMRLAIPISGPHQVQRAGAVRYQTMENVGTIGGSDFTDCSPLPAIIASRVEVPIFIRPRGPYHPNPALRILAGRRLEN